MSEPLDTAKERLGWAKESICSLSDRVRAFIATEPFLGASGIAREYDYRSRAFVGRHLQSFT